MLLLEVTEISKRFGEVQALDRVSFSAERGEVIAIMLSCLNCPTCDTPRKRNRAKSGHYNAKKKPPNITEIPFLIEVYTSFRSRPLSKQGAQEN